MRKVIVHEYVSVDGFAADTDGGLDWAAVGGDVDRGTLQELDGIDTMVLGARTYEIFARFWPTPESKSELIADKLNVLRKVVFSTSRLGVTGQRPSGSICGFPRRRPSPTRAS